MAERYALIVDRRENSKTLFKPWFKLVPQYIFDWCVLSTVDRPPRDISTHIIAATFRYNAFDDSCDLPDDTADSLLDFMIGLETVENCIVYDVIKYKMTRVPATFPELYFNSIRDIFETEHVIDERRIYVIK